MQYLALRTVYNIFFHPLAKYPGPLIWRAFRLPFIISNVRGELPHTIKAFHEKYGEVVRVAPDELSFTNPAAWRDIYPKNFLRPHEYKDKPPGKDAENLISATETDHTRFRKILAPAFSERATQEQEPLIKRYIDTLILKLHQEIKADPSGSTAMVDVLQWFNYTTFDVIGDLTWGSSFGCLDEKQYHPWVQVVSQFKAAIIVGMLKFYPPLDAILKAITPQSALAELMQMWKTTEEKVAQRLSMDVERPDIISHIITANKSPSGVHMSRAEIEINAMMVAVGGSESVTTVLTGITNYLLRDPAKLHILTQEVRTQFSTEQDITGYAVNRLPYVNAVLNEGLRLCPTIPDGMRRNTPKGGAAVAGHFLPENTVVSIPQWATYQSPANFSSPTSFIPERWLHNSSDPASPYSNDRRDGFNPFSLGPHNCPGQNLAWLEMRLILARMVWNFDLAIPSGGKLPQWDKQGIYWFWEKQATVIAITSVT